MLGKEQRAKEGCWLFIEYEDGSRDFLSVITLHKDASLLKECTNEEKLAWEDAHKVEEPIEVEQ